MQKRRLDWRICAAMIREAMRRTLAKNVSFADLMASMHSYAIMMPFMFDRIEYETETRLNNIFADFIP
jgi:hypothetical protein